MRELPHLWPAKMQQTTDMEEDWQKIVAAQTEQQGELKIALEGTLVGKCAMIRQYYGKSPGEPWSHHSTLRPI